MSVAVIKDFLSQGDVYINALSNNIFFYTPPPPKKKKPCMLYVNIVIFVRNTYSSHSCGFNRSTRSQNCSFQNITKRRSDKKIWTFSLQILASLASKVWYQMIKSMNNSISWEPRMVSDCIQKICSNPTNNRFTPYQRC